MIRKTLLSLTLVGVVLLPDIGSAQLAGNYDLIAVDNHYYYIVREMSNSLDDSLYASYDLEVHWPSSENSQFSWTIANYEVGDTVYSRVPLVSPALLGAFGIGLNTDVYEDGNIVITGTYPSLATSNCETQITIPAITDNATYATGGDPVVDDSAKTATFGWGFISSDVFANNMYAPDLAGGESVFEDFGAGSEFPTWGQWTSHYTDDYSFVESVEIYWEQIDAVESTYGVDEQGELNGHLGLSAAFGDNSTVPGLAATFPSLGLNVGNYPIIGGTGLDLDGDGEPDGVIPPPSLTEDGLEWGYLFDPKGADGELFSGDEATQFTGYYFTYNFLIGFGTLANSFLQFSDPEYLMDMDGDGIPETHQMVVQFMQQGQSATEALGNTAEAIATAAMTQLAVTFGVPEATAAVLGATVGAYAETTLLALLAAGTDPVDAITTAAQATGAQALGALESAGIDLDDSDHDFGDDVNHLANAGFENGLSNWENYPNANSQALIGTGETMYNTTETFTAAEGDSALKLWGMYSGGTNMENNAFQSFSGVFAEGDTFNISAQFYTHSADDLNQGGNIGVLFAKYFDSNWGMIGMDTAHFAGATTNNWHTRSVSCTVPAGPPAVVQVGVMHVQPTGDDHGSFYVDDFNMTSGASNNGRLVFQVGNDCIPRNQHVTVSSVWVNTADAGVNSDESLIPKEFALYDNYPNPFNPTTQIAVDLPEAAVTEITVWNIMGQKVATLYSGDLNAGHHTINFNGRDYNGKQLTSGMYLYRVAAGKYNATKKMTLMK